MKVVERRFETGRRHFFVDILESVEALEIPQIDKLRILSIIDAEPVDRVRHLKPIESS